MSSRYPAGRFRRKILQAGNPARKSNELAEVGIMSMDYCAAAAMDITSPPDRTTSVIPFIPRFINTMRQGMPEGGAILPDSPKDSAAMPGAGVSVIDVKDHIQSISRNLELTINEEVNRVVVIVCNLETREVLREIAAEDALNMSVTLHRRLA